RSDRRDYPPYGLFGGNPGAPSWNIVNPGTEMERILQTKVTDSLNPGDVIRHVQAGGGGWGDRLERDPAAVREDVLDDKVSIEKAEELYGVVIDPQTKQVDQTATLSKRAGLRAAS